MYWTMPHRVLQIVATMIVLAAITAFALGVLNAPQRGRLPGEKAASGAPAAAIDATDATPLVDQRLDGPPEPTPEELEAKAKAEEEAKAKAEAEAHERAAAEAAAAGNAPVLAVPRPPIAGNTATPDQTLGGPPAPDEPPH
jgi:hypothetical protein